MVRMIKITELNDLKEFMRLATSCDSDVGVHTEDNQIVDAKSILGFIVVGCGIKLYIFS